MHQGTLVQQGTDMKGKIVTDRGVKPVTHVVTCYTCNDTQFVQDGHQSGSYRRFVKLGWKKRGKLRVWLCPLCSKQGG